MARRANPTAIMELVNKRVSFENRGTTGTRIIVNGIPLKKAGDLKLTAYAASPGFLAAVNQKKKEWEKANPRAKRAPKVAKGAAKENGNNGSNANNEAEAEMGRNSWKRGGVKFRTKRTKARAKGIVGVPQPRPNAGIPLEMAFFAEASGKYNPAVWQAQSGSELETRAIEAGVAHAGIARSKFDRGNSPAKIFSHRERTFIFKPRFTLDDIKRYSAEGNTNRDRGMLELLRQCEIHAAAAKGKDDIEPDVIEWIPSTRTIRIYECKIGSGKSEGFPGEAFQLLKAKRLIEKMWENWANKPQNGRPLNIELYFLAWQFSVIPPPGVEWVEPAFTNHATKYPKISEDLNKGHPGWDKIKPLKPPDFQEKTAISWKFIQAHLESHRQKLLVRQAKLISTLAKRGAFQTTSPETRRHLANIHARTRFVSGAHPHFPIVRGNAKTLSARRRGAWSRVVRGYRPKNNQSGRNKRIFAEKFERSIRLLIKKGWFKLSGRNLPSTSGNQFSNSEEPMPNAENNGLGNQTSSASNVNEPAPHPRANSSMSEIVGRFLVYFVKDYRTKRFDPSATRFWNSVKTRITVVPEKMTAATFNQLQGNININKLQPEGAAILMQWAPSGAYQMPRSQQTPAMRRNMQAQPAYQEYNMTNAALGSMFGNK